MTTLTLIGLYGAIYTSEILCYNYNHRVYLLNVKHLNRHRAYMQLKNWLLNFRASHPTQSVTTYHLFPSNNVITERG